MRIRSLLFVALLVIMVVPLQFTARPASASVSTWQKGMSVSPLRTGYFGSSGFRTAIDNISRTGVDSIALIIPYTQSSTTSTDVRTTSLTPTDTEVRSAIDYIHSKGMAVMLKPHMRTASGEWAAYIDPPDRATWFRNYGAMIMRYARIGQERGVELISIGAEMTYMSSATHDSTNTENWRQLIGNVRSVYSGKLTFSAHWGGAPHLEEKDQIAFWPQLDFIGIAAYFVLDTSTDSVASLKARWQRWDSEDIGPLQRRYNRPVLFTEVGYRNVDGHRFRPWDWTYQSWNDEQEQANLYEALISYWDQVSSFQGVYLWEWNDELPSSNTYYSPKGKLAEKVLVQRFGGSSSSPTPTPTPPPPAASSIVYDDSLRWDDWSWNTTVDPWATSPTYAGSRSMSVTYRSAWAALSLHTDGFSTAPYSHLEFALHPNGQPFPGISASLYDAAGAQIRDVSVQPYASGASGGWYVVRIPLSALGGQGRTITRVQLQEMRGGAQPTFNVDNVRFVSSGGGTPPGGAAQIYGDSLQWEDWSWQTSIDPNASYPVRSGSRSMAVTYNAPWAGLSFHTSGFTTDGYAYLTFAVNPGGSPLPRANASLYDTQGGLIKQVPIGSYATSAGSGWYIVRIPLSALDGANRTITRVQLQEGGGTRPPTFHIDDLGFTS